jgi:hypothetical protein
MQDCGRSLASASAIKRETVSSGRRPGDCIASQARRVPGHRRRRSSHRKARSQEAERASFAARPRHAKATHWRAGARQRCGSRGYQDAVATSQGSPPPWPVPTYWGRAFFVRHILTAGARAVQGRLPPDGRGCQRIAAWSGHATLTEIKLHRRCRSGADGAQAGIDLRRRTILRLSRPCSGRRRPACGSHRSPSDRRPAC